MTPPCFLPTASLRWALRLQGLPAGTFGARKSGTNLRAQPPLRAAVYRFMPNRCSESCYREIPALSKREILEQGLPASFLPTIGRWNAACRKNVTNTSLHLGDDFGADDGHHGTGLVDGPDRARLPGIAHPAPIRGPAAPQMCARAVGCSSNLCPYEDHPFPNRFFDGTVYLNLSSDPFAFPESEWDRIVVELQATQPDLLEGEPVYLALLARAARKRGVSVPSIKAVILTYGKASRQHSRRIAEVFPAPRSTSTARPRPEITSLSARKPSRTIPRSSTATPLSSSSPGGRAGTTCSRFT